MNRQSWAIIPLYFKEGSHLSKVHISDQSRCEAVHK